MSVESPVRRLHVWSGLIMLGVFLAGAVAGAGVVTWLRPPPPPRHRTGPGGFPGWASELNLTTEQQQKARTIFEKHHAEVEGILKQSFPQVRAAQEEMDRELRAILTPEQMKKLDEIRERRPRPSEGGRFGPPFGPPGFHPPPGKPPPPSETSK
jgi:Spy/CpxP family protein refolding chaperone